MYDIQNSGVSALLDIKNEPVFRNEFLCTIHIKEEKITNELNLLQIFGLLINRKIPETTIHSENIAQKPDFSDVSS